MTETSIVLQQLGFRSIYLGFYYLSDAVALVLSDDTYLVTLIKRLYPDIAQKHQTTGPCVERAIRTAISYFWKTGNKKMWYNLLGYELTKKPTNGEFIDILSCHIRETMTMKIPNRNGWLPSYDYISLQ